MDRLKFDEHFIYGYDMENNVDVHFIAIEKIEFDSVPHLKWIKEDKIYIITDSYGYIRGHGKYGTFYETNDLTHEGRRQAQLSLVDK